MTVEYLKNFFKPSKSKFSDKTVKLANGKELPCFILEERSSDPRELSYGYFSYSERYEEYSERWLYWDEALLAHHLFHNKPEQLQMLLNDGTVYKYICKKLLRAKKEVEKNVIEAQKHDRECQLAKLCGDEELYQRLVNNLALIIKAEVYKNMVWD